MLNMSRVGNIGEAQSPCATFVMEGDGQETGATGSQEKAEALQIESLQATAQQPVLQHKAQPETDVSGTGEKLVLLADDIVVVEEVLGLNVEETVVVAALQEVASGGEEDAKSKRGKEEEKEGMQEQDHEEEEEVLEYVKEEEQDDQDQKCRKRWKSRRKGRVGRRRRSKRSVGGGGTGGDGGAETEDGRVGEGVDRGERGGAGATGCIRAGGGSRGGGKMGVEGDGVIAGRIGTEEQEEEELEQELKGQEEENKKKEQEEQEQKNEEQKQKGQGVRWMEQLLELMVKQEKKVQLESGLCAGLTPLEALEALQVELQPVNKQASWEHYQLKLRIYKRRLHYLEERSALIQGIPGFWAKSVSFMLVMEGSRGGWAWAREDKLRDISRSTGVECRKTPLLRTGTRKPYAIQRS